MGCYTVPAAAAIIHFFMRKKIPTLNTKHSLWLNQLYFGGGIFGVVDHIWNGELLLFSLSDVLLGFTITLAITIIWGMVVALDNATSKTQKYKS